MFTRQNIVRLLLAGLLLALLAIPVLGVALGTGVAANDASDSTLFSDAGPTGAGIELACPDPGGNNGGGC